MQVSEVPLIVDDVEVSDLPVVAAQFLSRAGEEKIWLIEGEMGAGKTTFIKTLCKQLGVIDSMSSPTFSIVNEYLTSTNEHVFHFDFYRLKSEREAIDIGIEDYFYSGAYCFIEWSERIKSLIPEHHALVSIQPKNQTTRTLSLTIHGR